PTGRTKHLFSKAEFGDCRAHIEFMVPKGSNSGVYFQGRYEVQVLDSWGVETPGHGDCGGIYQRWDDKREPKGYEGHPPRVNAARAPGEWQSFDVVFRAPRFDSDGNKIENARFVEVVHNGVLVHENVSLNGPTRSSRYNDEKPMGLLMFQGDHGPVAYRNIWVTPYSDLPAERGATPMNHFFAMSTGTVDKKHATPALQAAMVKELGYDGTDYLGISKLENLGDYLTAMDQCGVPVFAIYVEIWIDAGADHWNPALPDALALLKGRGTVVWASVRSKKHASSSPEGDAEGVEALRALADLAAANDLLVSLYPHTSFWIERVEDAVRLAKNIDHPDVGATFNLCHWLMVDGENLDARLELAAPHLSMVTISGADAGGDNWKALIQNLDQGTYDVGLVLKKLDALGYRGPIGLQGYGIGGDVYRNLENSMTAWRALQANRTVK
ncbi:MAG: DUF1080 domain-containing protein, partial [bacterium]|nr:DUF1080 domain-containing protein [bacterium]